jgi:hypothetical protein
MDQPSHIQQRALEEAISRVLRDNLASVQRTAEELQVACADFVAACSSSRPTNSLPAMLRTQTAAASLSARLAVLSNLVTSALQPKERSAEESSMLREVASEVATQQREVSPPAVPAPVAEAQVRETSISELSQDFAPSMESSIFEESASTIEDVADSAWAEVAGEVAEPLPESTLDEPLAEEQNVFDLARLPAEEQELHRRANRVAKVGMQDIQLLRPEQVRLGREHKDLCTRLRSDLDKARKEYDRRFHSIADHPVDYFHHWLVAILAAGDHEALGEYPYPSPVLRH